MSDETRPARRNKGAIAGIVLVLLTVTICAVWSSQVMANAADKTARSSLVSHEFEEAASAIAAGESLGQKYRLEPGPEVLADFDASSDKATDALRRAGADGTAAQSDMVDHILELIQGYRASVHRMFSAVDDGYPADVLRIAAVEVDPAFDKIQALVEEQAAAERDVADAHIQSLRQLEGLWRWLTPAVFVIGLLLMSLLGTVTRAYRRMLDVERIQALHDSLHDALTGLPNRAFLAARFDKVLEEGALTGARTGLLLIDLDRFKAVNDTFGHHYGDELLAQVGHLLRANVRTEDTIARLGGDEFAVLLPDVGDLPTATRVAEVLRRALETTFLVEGVDLDVEASIGIVLSGVHGDDAPTLLQRADVAMYVAKSQGLGLFVYNPEADRNSPGRLALLGELRRAIENGELFLSFQAQVSIGTGEVIGVEALVRWEHPALGVIYPDDFLPIAEHTGLIRPLTTFVLSAALTHAKSWSDAGRTLPVSVNLSARNLLDEDLPRQVAELLATHGVPASLLKLEVTESAIMVDPPSAARLLRELADLGVEISIDDFGAGYTSLGQLKSLPITELKIDKSFVMNMTDDASDALIVRSVIELGHNLGLAIIAEGVESAAALEQLASAGCDAAQGYHLCRPMPAAEFDDWLGTHGETCVVDGEPSAIGAAGN